MTTRSKSQIFVILSISDSTYTENHKYLRFATSFLTLGGNLLRVNRFFSICVCDTQTQMRYGNAPLFVGADGFIASFYNFGS